jgi:hypothetical protein
LIIQEYYQKQSDIVIENDCEILLLPFKKINLVPPENTKPFGTVRLKKCRPAVTTVTSTTPINTQQREYDNLQAKIQNVEENDKEKEATAEAEEILLAEFTWDRSKLKYVHISIYKIIDTKEFL